MVQLVSHQDAVEKIEAARSDGATRLDLSGNQLTTVPAELAQLTNLTRLVLSGNQLPWLPHELSALVELRRIANSFETAQGYLRIDGNRFDDGPMEAANRGIDEFWDYLRTNDPPETVPPPPTDLTVHDLVPDGLEWNPKPDPDTILELRPVLEQLVGVTTHMIEDSRFADDPMKELRITRDRNYLRDELFENPDVFDASMIALLGGRVLATVVPELPDGPDKELLLAIAGNPHQRPESAEAASAVLDKAQEIADRITPDHENLPPDTTPSQAVTNSLGWSQLERDAVGLASGVATLVGLVATAGLAGSAAAVLGAAIGLLFLYRRKS